MRTFRIAFIRKATEEVCFLLWYDEGGGLIYDETEFDTEYKTDEVVWVDLINMFNQFVQENHFEDVTVVDIKEVPYDGEEE